MTTNRDDANATIKATTIGWPRDEELAETSIRLGFTYVPRAHEAALIEHAARAAK